LLLIQQQMIASMNNSMKQIVVFTCLRTTSTICNAINEMKIQMNCEDYDDHIEQLTNQTEFMKEPESSFSIQMNSLEELANKQNKILNKALATLFKDPYA
jgi:Mg2+ and Co2+ transporter CorA